MRRGLQIFFVLFLGLVGGGVGNYTEGSSFILTGSVIGLLSGLFLLFMEYLVTERSGREIHFSKNLYGTWRLRLG